MLRPLDDMTEPVLRRVHSWWQSHRTTEALPSRRDLDPADLREVLPHLFIVDVLHGRLLDFRYRLVGTAIEDYAGVRLTGSTVRELPIDGEQRFSIISQYGRSMHRREPTYCEHAYVVARKKYVRYRRFVAPLSTVPPLVDMLLGAMIFEVSYRV
jgi:hypothetical protein